MKQPILYQRIEAAVVFVASLYFYVHSHLNVILFFVLLLAVDVFMLGYLANNRLGVHLYNIGHSFIIPPILLIIGTSAANNVLIGAGLIWAAHIAIDRAFGYGLKFDTSFQDTHLGKIGKK